MALLDTTPDEDPLVQSALSLSVVNDIMCHSTFQTEKTIKQCQDFFFCFGASISKLLHEVVTTKLHRLMRHIVRHLILLVCLRRGSSDENEMHHEQFKRILTALASTLISLGSSLSPTR